MIAIAADEGGLISLSLSLIRQGDIATRRCVVDGLLSVLTSANCDLVISAVDEQVKAKQGAIETHADVCISFIHLAAADDDWEVKCSLSRVIAALFGLNCRA